VNKKVLVGDLVNGRPVHFPWVPGDTLIDPDGNVLGSSFGFFNNIFASVLFKNEIPTPTTTLTDSSAGALQTAITAASAGDIILIDVDATYTPIQIPASKPLAIFVNTGRSVDIDATGVAYGILFKAGAENIIIQGIEVHNQQGSNTPGCTDNAGGICQEAGIVKNVLLKDIDVYDCDEAGIQFQRMTAVTLSPTGPEDLSRNLYVVNCYCYNCSRVDSTENGAIAFYDCRDVFVMGNRCTTSLRGVMCSNVVNGYVQGNKCYSNKYEGIKFDTVASTQYPSSTGTVCDNIVYGNGTVTPVAGIRADDMSGIVVMNNTVYNDAGDGIMIEDDSDSTLVINNIVHSCAGTGILTENSVDRILVLNNISYNNTTADYSLGTGTPASISNLTVDPQLVNPGSGDFRPSDTSPAYFSGYENQVIGTTMYSWSWENMWGANLVRLSVIAKQWLRDMFFDRTERSGVASFAANTSLAITFRYDLPSADYRVMLQPLFDTTAAGAFWVTSKTASGFTINFTNAATGDVDWFVESMGLS